MFGDWADKIPASRRLGGQVWEKTVEIAESSDRAVRKGKPVVFAGIVGQILGLKKEMSIGLDIYR